MIDKVISNRVKLSEEDLRKLEELEYRREYIRRWCYLPGDPRLKSSGFLKD